MIQWKKNEGMKEGGEDVAREGPNELNTKTLFRLTIACLCGVFLLSFLCYAWELKEAKKAARGTPVPLSDWVQTNLEQRTAHLSDRQENGTEQTAKKTVTLLWTTFNSTYNGSDQSGHARAAFLDDDGELHWFPTIVYTALDGQDEDEPGSFKHAGRYLARVVCDAATRALLGDEYALPADRTHEYEIQPYPLSLEGLTLTAQDKYYDGTTNVTFTDAQICLTGPFEGQEAFLLVQGALLSSQSDFEAVARVTGVALVSTHGHRSADFALQGVFDLYTPTTVLPLPINAARAEFEAHKTFTGEEQTFAVRRIVINGLSADFTVSGNTATDVGSYEMTVTGIGNFTGTLTLPFTIGAAQRSVVVATIADVVYDGQTHTPSVSVTSGGNALVQGRDYTVSYSGGTDAGTATATVMLQGEYNGSISQTYTVQPKSMPDIDGVYMDNIVFIYTGEEITPYVRIMDGNRYLSEKKDYDLIYVDNIYPGTGSVTVVYKGNYTGSVTLPFTIEVQSCTDHWLLLFVFMIQVVGAVIISLVTKDKRRKRAAVIILSALCTVSSAVLGFFAGCLVCFIVWFCIVALSCILVRRECRPDRASEQGTT